MLERLKNPISFTTSKGQRVFGYSADVFLEVIDVVLVAKKANKLLKSQHHVGLRCEALKKALPSIGIIALIDESTGYQKIRKQDALKILVEKYITEQGRIWMKEYSDNFFNHLDKIYGNKKTTSQNRPKYYANFINNHIYKPLEKGIIHKKLIKINPADSKGNRKKRFHQFFTEDYGIRILRDRIAQITALLKISSSKIKFDQHYSKLEYEQESFSFGDDYD